MQLLHWEQLVVQCLGQRHCTKLRTRLRPLTFQSSILILLYWLNSTTTMNQRTTVNSLGTPWNLAKIQKCCYTLENEISVFHLWHLKTLSSAVVLLSLRDWAFLEQQPAFLLADVGSGITVFRVKGRDDSTRKMNAAKNIHILNNKTKQMWQFATSGLADYLVSVCR